MAKRIVITEEQYNKAIKEGITLKADVAGANGDVKRAVDITKQEAMKNGVKMDDATISIDASETNESTFVKKSDLLENRLKALKNNSTVYSLRDFMDKITCK